jgi:hypothetical protein
MKKQTDEKKKITGRTERLAIPRKLQGAAGPFLSEVEGDAPTNSGVVC